MTAPTETEWEAGLKVRANGLWQDAKRRPGTWSEESLPNDWKLGLSVDPQTKAIEIRFRMLCGGPISWVEFLAEARRLAQQLGAGDWQLRETRKQLWWEASFIQISSTEGSG